MIYYSSYGSSNFYNWGRWVLLGCIIAVAILCLLIFVWRKRRTQMFNQNQNMTYPVQPQGYAPDNYNMAEAGMAGYHNNNNYNQGYGQGYYGQGPAQPMGTQPVADRYHYTSAESAPAYEKGDNFAPPPGPPPGFTAPSSSNAPSYVPPPAQHNITQ